MFLKTNRKSFINRIGKYVFVVFLAATLAFCPAGAKKTDAWDAIPAAAFHRVLDTIYDGIKGAIMGALKQAAASMINSMIEKLVSGGSSSSTKFIYDWQSYLKDQPNKIANTYVNDYLSQVTGGMAAPNFVSSEGFASNLGSGIGGSLGSSLGQKAGGSLGSTLGNAVGSGVGSTLGSIGGSYAQQLVNKAKASTSKASDSDFKLSYTDDPEDMFSEGDGDMEGLNSYLYGDGGGNGNTPMEFEINAKNVWSAKQESEKEIAKTKADAYGGYVGTGEKDGEGYVTTPGSNTKDAVSNAQDIGNKIIAGSTHPAEVITSIITSVITKAIQTGIGSIANLVSQKIGGPLGSIVGSGISGAANGAINGATSSWNNSSSSDSFGLGGNSSWTSSSSGGFSNLEPQLFNSPEGTTTSGGMTTTVTTNADGSQTTTTRGFGN